MGETAGGPASDFIPFPPRYPYCLETDDPKKLAAFSHMWSDLMELTITPVLEDQELSDVLQGAMK